MDILFSLAAFAFVTSFTPGPNNILLLASGLRFGFWPTLPHILGIQLGIAVQLVLAGFGLGALILKFPALNLALKVFGTAYLLYLAMQLRKNLVGDEKGRAQPFTFLEAAVFQFVNPKAWLMTVTAGTLFLPQADSVLGSIFLLCLVFHAVGAPSSGSWAVFGALIKRYLSRPFWQKCFSWSMVAITVYTAVALWFF